MTYTWHKSICDGCGHVRRYRGKARLGSRFERDAAGCGAGYFVVTEIHWGPEKYAQGRGGTVERLGVAS